MLREGNVKLKNRNGSPTAYGISYVLGRGRKGSGYDGVTVSILALNFRRCLLLRPD
jgi:hypothetical protein